MRKTVVHVCDRYVGKIHALNHQMVLGHRRSLNPQIFEAEYVGRTYVYGSDTKGNAIKLISKRKQKPYLSRITDNQAYTTFQNLCMYSQLSIDNPQYPVLCIF